MLMEKTLCCGYFFYLLHALANPGSTSLSPHHGFIELHDPLIEFIRSETLSPRARRGWCWIDGRLGHLCAAAALAAPL